MINNRIKILKKIGEGRSKVFLCEITEYPERKFALKVFSNKNDSEEYKAFRDEFYLLEKLDHPNIISVFEYGVILREDKNEFKKYGINEGDDFFTLEYFDGDELLDYKKIRDENTLLKIIKQISNVLYFIHQSNYIYYDLKQENILIKEVNGEPFIKFIDFGFAKFIPSIEEFYVRGTSEYIAPEILLKETTDHRADLYSLGILLYRIIFDKFPFDTDSELEVYKAHVERDFEYPDSDYSHELVKVVKKLLSKSPSSRFYTVLQLLDELKIEIDSAMKSNWNSSKNFSGRKEVLYDLKNYLTSPPEGKVLDIIGGDAIGKTTLLKEIEKNYNNVVSIRFKDYSGTYKFWKYFLQKLLFSDFIYLNSDESIIQYALLHLSEESEELITDLKSIAARLSLNNNFILIIDDFNLLDELSLEILHQTIPIFQANNIPVLLSENSYLPLNSGFINNLEEINLKLFSEDTVNDFIQKSFAAFFPRDQIIKIIIKYSDLMPGNIDSFISDLILLEILDFSVEGPFINSDEESIEELSKSIERIFDIRIRDLNDAQLKLLQMLSAMNINLDPTVFRESLELSYKEIDAAIDFMREKNLLLNKNISVLPQISSLALKKHIYGTVKEKSDLHKSIAEILLQYANQIDLFEIARHYELCGEYEKSFQILEEELKRAEKVSAFSYQKQLLEHILEFPLEKEIISHVKFDLSKVYLDLGDNKNSFNLIEELLIDEFEVEDINKIKSIKAKCLSGLGKMEESLDTYEEILAQLDDEKLRNNLLVEMADIHFDLGNFEKVKTICNNSVNETEISPKAIGKSYNSLGLIEIYRNNNPKGAIKYFKMALEIYKKSNTLLKVAGIEVNLGNIYNMLLDPISAEKHWKRAIQVNQSIGNLEQEAKVLLNYGIFYYDKLEFENALEQYNRAYNIFVGLGNKNGIGLVLTNMGETNTIICNFEVAVDNLLKAKQIFNELMNREEESEAIFLLAKLYHSFGHFDAFKSIIDEYSIFVGDTQSTERENINLTYLKLIESLYAKGADKNYNKIIEISDTYFEQKDKFNFAEAILILCEFLIKNKDYENAFCYLNKENLLEYYEQNRYFFGWYNLLMGIISRNKSDGELKSEIEYYETAYEILREESITELTWRVLFELGKYYLNRGNYRKAKSFIKYSKSLINFIAENIHDQKLKSTYLSHPERFLTLNQLSEFEQKLA